jgi:AraC-like DNA-binding protein
MESARMDLRIQKAIRYLQKSPSCKLKDFATSCNISESRLSHLFKAVTGVTLEEYRRKYRLSVASRMLLSSDMPIKEIAYRLGYRHTSSFVRAFKAELPSGCALHSGRSEFLKSGIRFASV